MLGFSFAETEFFLAGDVLPQASGVQDRPARIAQVRLARRAALRLIVGALVAGASVLAWYGPGRVAAPIAMSHVQIAEPAQTSALARAGALFAPVRQISQAPAPAKAAAPPAVRPKPHPATANRSRSRHR
jgi:hypothetical protein